MINNKVTINTPTTELSIAFDSVHTGLRFSGYPVMMTLSRFSHVQLFVTRWTAAHQAPLSMRFSRQEYRSWLPFPPPGDLPEPGIEPGYPIGIINSVRVMGKCLRS